MIGPRMVGWVRLSAVLALAGCATAMPGMPAIPAWTDAEHVVLVNGRAVRTGSHTSLLGLLRDHVSADLLGGPAPTVDDLPLVVLDGVPIRDGFAWLQRLLLIDVRSVTVLRSGVAFARWGALAARGAIVVETRRGRVVWRNR